MTTNNNAIESELKKAQSFMRRAAEIHENLRKRLFSPNPILKAHRIARGSSRRLTDAEEAEIVDMLKAKDDYGNERYTVQEISSHFETTRVTVYNIRDKYKLDVHRRNALFSVV